LIPLNTVLQVLLQIDLIFILPVFYNEKCFVKHFKSRLKYARTMFPGLETYNFKAKAAFFTLKWLGKDLILIKKAGIL